MGIAVYRKVAPLASGPYELPPDLPVPSDDGACDHLAGAVVPHVRLRSTRAREVDVGDVAQGRAVFFFYPATGRPDEPTPPEWDQIPGARGCTPQNRAYRDRYGAFRDLGAEVFGVSAQAVEDQSEFAARMHIPYELLSDARFELALALRLPTFEFQGRRYIRRLTLIAEGGTVHHVFYPVFPPDRNAEEVLAFLRQP